MISLFTFAIISNDIINDNIIYTFIVPKNPIERATELLLKKVDALKLFSFFFKF